MNAHVNLGALAHLLPQENQCGPDTRPTQSPAEKRV